MKSLAYYLLCVLLVAFTLVVLFPFAMSVTFAGNIAGPITFVIMLLCWVGAAACFVAAGRPRKRAAAAPTRPRSLRSLPPRRRAFPG